MGIVITDSPDALVATCVGESDAVNYIVTEDRDYIVTESLDELITE